MIPNYKSLTSSQIRQINWKNTYKLDEHSSNILVRITTYLIFHISPKTNDYKYKVTNLAKVFGCSRSTIYRAIRIIRNTGGFIIKKHHIHFKNYTPIKDLKGGDMNE